MSTEADAELIELDDDLITCAACLRIYDDQERRPKFLDCHHSFCSSCIQDFDFDGESVLCPSCNAETNMVDRDVDDLPTNHYALRLIEAAGNQAKIAAELNHVRREAAETRSWCIECSSITTEECSRNHHVACQFEPLFQQTSADLEARLTKCTSVWDQIVFYRRNIRDKYQQLASYLCYLLSKVESKINANESIIENISCYQDEAMDFPQLACEPDMTDENLTNTMNRLNEINTRLGWWEDEADVISPQREMKALASIEEQCVRVSLEQTQGGEPVPQVRLLERLPLSFSATGHPHPINACVAVLTYVMLMLTEEEAKSSRSAGLIAANQLKKEKPPVSLSEPKSGASALIRKKRDGRRRLSDRSGAEASIGTPTEGAMEVATAAVDADASEDALNGTVRLPWKCQTCDKGFRLVQSYQQHLISHSTERPFACPLCRTACKRKGDLAKHMRSHPEPHPELPDASPQLAKPRRRRPNVSTEEDAADDGVEVDASSSSEEPVKLEPFAIEAILSQQQQHQQQQQLQQQLQQQQEQQEQQLASVGDSEQLAEDDANNSQQLVNGFQCKTCFKVFNLRQSLHQHMYTHSTERPFECRICGMACKRIGDLNKHMRSHPKSAFRSAGATVFKRSSNFHKHSAFPASSSQSALGRAGRPSLKIRIKLKKKSPLPSPVDADAVGTDDAADGETAVAAAAADASAAVEEGAIKTAHLWKCDFCEKAFEYQCYLKRHVTTTHSSVYPFQCTMCHRAFKTRSHLNRHMKRGHQVNVALNHKVGPTSNSRPFTCTTCGKGFNWKQDLTRHAQLHQQEGRQFKCSKCGKDFVRSDRCRRHEKICNSAFVNEPQANALGSIDGEGALI